VIIVGQEQDDNCRCFVNLIDWWNPEKRRTYM